VLGFLIELPPLRSACGDSQLARPGIPASAMTLNILSERLPGDISERFAFGKCDRSKSFVLFTLNRRKKCYRRFKLAMSCHGLISQISKPNVIVKN
jgi:hypothetical protein